MLKLVVVSACDKDFSTTFVLKVSSLNTFEDNFRVTVIESVLYVERFFSCSELKITYNSITFVSRGFSKFLID